MTQIATDLLGMLLPAGLVILIFWLMLSARLKGLDRTMSDMLDRRMGASEESLRNEFGRNREEYAKSSRDGRDEIGRSFNDFRQQTGERLQESSRIQREQLENFSSELDKLRQTVEKNLEKLVKSFEERAERQNSLLTESLDKMAKSFEEKSDRLNETTEKRLQSLQEDNQKSLDKMRETVDEKLHKTLEERLGQSFKLVSDRLELVQKGLGEMQNLATGVGDLKRVLTNVKTLGNLGEYQLENILEQVLSPEQYEKDVKVDPRRDHVVEFAVKFPGRGDTVWVPIDSKFPVSDYQNLQLAIEAADKEAADAARKSMLRSLRTFAKDISEKYIVPPHTTDFAIMFVPIEGLFAEILRDPETYKDLRDRLNIIVSGPTYLSAILNSFKLGFRSLAIERHSSEVWKVLGEVKTEFAKFGGILDKARNNIHQANKHLDTLAGTRSNVIERKLRDVEQLPATDSGRVLGSGETGGEAEENSRELDPQLLIDLDFDTEQ